MQELNHRGRMRWRLGGLLVALLAALVAAVGAATMSAHAQTTVAPVAPRTVSESDADLSGRYLGNQDDVRFGMAPQQDGTIVRGVIVQPLPQLSETDFIDADSAALAGDRVFGIVNGDQIFLIRFSDPAQFWFGEVSRSASAIEMQGRWVSNPGAGTWQAKSARGPELAINARLTPDEIEAGETTRLQYGVRIGNTGARSARSLQLDLRGLPDFYRIDSIEIVRGHLADDLDALAGTPIALSALGNTLSLPLDDLEPGAAVLVRVGGAAAPEDEHEGEHTTRAIASADNARSVATRVTLTVTAGPLLTVHARVAPETIEAGETSRVSYGVLIGNEGSGPAGSVHLDVHGLPAFFLIDSIEIVRGRLDANLDAQPGTALAIGASAGNLSLPLGDLEADDAVLVRISGAATPEREGEYVSLATASARDARSGADRVLLTVEGSALRVANAFSPAVISASTDDAGPDLRDNARDQERADGRPSDALRPSIVVGRDGLVTYTITVTVQPFHEVVFTDASIFGILRGALVDVHGAASRGNLATGLVLTPLTAARDTAAEPVTVTIIVSGDAGHLAPGRYTASVSALAVSPSSAVSPSGTERAARSTAVLTVTTDRNSDRDTDRDRIGGVDRIQIDGVPAG